MEAEVASRAAGDDAEEAVAHVEEKSCIGMFEMDDEIESARYFNVIDGGECSALGGDQGSVDHAANGPGHVFGFEWTAIVEMDTIAQVDDERERIGLLPACGQPRLQVVVLIFLYQRVEDQAADALGLRVRSLAQVEVVGAALNDEDYGLRVARVSAAAGEKRKEIRVLC